MYADPNSPDPQINAVSLTLPPYPPQNPQLWFLQLENLFKLHSIKNQEVRYLHASVNLPVDVATQVQDILTNPPKDNPYDALKQAILSRNADSKETRLEQVLSGLELGNRTPSQLLRHMRSLVPDFNLDDHVLRQLWIKRLPPELTPILTFAMDNVALDKLAEMADKISEYSRTTRVHNITHTDPTTDQISHRLSRMEIALSKLWFISKVHLQFPKNFRTIVCLLWNQWCSMCYFATCVETLLQDSLRYKGVWLHKGSLLEDAVLEFYLCGYRDVFLPGLVKRDPHPDRQFLLLALQNAQRR